MLGNLARPVSRGERGSDAPALPDCGIKLLGKEAITATSPSNVLLSLRS